MVAAKVLSYGEADAASNGLHKPDIGPIAEIPPFTSANYPTHNSFESLTSNRARHTVLLEYGETIDAEKECGASG